MMEYEGIDIFREQLKQGSSTTEFLPAGENETGEQCYMKVITIGDKKYMADKIYTQSELNNLHEQMEEFSRLCATE